MNSIGPAVLKSNLILSKLGQKISRRDFEIFFFSYFLHEISFDILRQFTLNVKAYFLGKKETYYHIINLSSAINAESSKVLLTIISRKIKKACPKETSYIYGCVK